MCAMITNAQAKFLRSADQDGFIRVSRQCYADRKLGGKAVEMAHRLRDAGLLTLEGVEFRSTAKCSVKDHTFRITDAGRAALARKARVADLIEELAAEA
jgi:hypothetical protein